MERLEKLKNEWKKLKYNENLYKEQRLEKEQEIFEELKNRGQYGISQTFMLGDDKMSVSFSLTMSVDNEELNNIKDTLTPSQKEMYKLLFREKQEVNKQVFDELLQENNKDVNFFYQFIKTKENKPYIKVTENKKEN